MNWLFNIDRFSSFTGKNKEHLIWEQARNFSGKQNDQIIFYSFSNKENFFSFIYSIFSINIEQRKFEEINKTPIKIEIEIYKVKKFSEPKELENYIYSISRIKQYDKYLYRHFNRKYYRLSELEFNAIENDEIFESRTIIGTALNAMHVDHRKAFANYLVENYPQVLQNICDYDAILTLFNNYLNFAVLTPAKQLTDSFTILQKLFDSKKMEEIAFSDEESQNKLNFISKQVVCIKENESNLKNDLISSIEKKKLRNENKFQRLFKKNVLPIDLT